MSTTRIKEKLSTLVLSQLPEFIQSDHTTFVSFLETYYEFLEQDQNAQELLQNAKSYNDIDTTIDSFVEYFLKQYSNDIPRDALYNKKALVKNIQDLYQNKGNEKSYKLLFRILYNKDIDIYYPSARILKASDGKWVQSYSFFMRTVIGDGNVIVDKNIFITSSVTKFPIYVSKRAVATSSQGTSTTVFEYFFDNTQNVPVNIGDIIEYAGFKGEVVGIPTAAVVTIPGAGFRIGDILTLTSGTGNAAKLKITKVNSSGGILNVQLINYGIGYIGDFYGFFSPSAGTTSLSTFSFDGNTASINSSLSGFVERGTITSTSTYATEYFAEDYEGIVIREFFYTSASSDTTVTRTSGSIVSLLNSPSDAAIYISIGSKTKYPGYYENIDGFLSDDNFLEDQDFYQLFSYVIKIDERLSLYKKAVLDILHPAGTKLFGELLQSTSIDLSAEITATLRYLASRLQNEFGSVDDGDIKEIFTFPTDSNSTSEFISKQIDKPFANIVDEILDNITKQLSKSATDTSSTQDDGDNKNYSKVIGQGDVLPYGEANYFAENYVERAGENLLEFSDNNFDLVLERILSNTISVADVTAVAYNSNIIRSVTLTDSSSIGINNSITDSATLTDSTFSKAVSVIVNLSSATLSNTFTSITINKSNIGQVLDSGTIFSSDYGDITYFAENYVGAVIYSF